MWYVLKSSWPDPRITGMGLAQPCHPYDLPMNGRHNHCRLLALCPYIYAHAGSSIISHLFLHSMGPILACGASIVP